jgi:hypothetical protein
MSKNIHQVFIANPITSNASTDLMYFGQSPYGVGDDAAMTYANFALQFGAPYTASALTKTDDTNVTLTLGGSASTALLNAASITAGWTGQLSPARGGTGVNNGTSTMTIAANFEMAGAFSFVGTLTGATTVTFPTTGTLATTAQIPAFTPSALTKTDDTNVTLTLGGTPATALLQATSITAGWTGTLAGTRGGTGVNNGASTITIGGSVTFSGAYTFAGTLTGNTAVTFPTSGTLATTAQLPVGITTWTDVTGTSANLVASNGYLANNAGLVTFTMPATCPKFAEIEINGVGVGGWTIAQLAGQRINYNSVTTTVGVGGSLSSVNKFNCVKLRCIVADTDFEVVNVVGNLDYI